MWTPEEDLIAAVEAAADLRPGELAGRDRAHEVALPRHVAMHLLRERGLSWPRIGAALRRHHTTVMLDVRRLRARLAGGDREALRVLEAINQHRRAG